MSRKLHVPSVTLDDGVEIPQIGLGLGNGIRGEAIAPIVTAALDIGYRSFDTATRYGNERGLGLALAQSGIPREEVFVTTKVWNDHHGKEATRRSFERSLDELGLEYVDLYLIHFPAPELGLYVETWLTLEALCRSGGARAVGVANFDTMHLSEILRVGSMAPAVNQVELQPRLQQTALRAMHAEHGIRTEAWGPLARGLVLRDPIVESIAARRGATPAQVVLRWHMQLGTIVIPRSTSPDRMRENLEAVDVAPLEPDEMAAFAALDCDGRTGPRPDQDPDEVDMRIDAVEERWNRILRDAEASPS